MLRIEDTPTPNLTDQIADESAADRVLIAAIDQAVTAIRAGASLDAIEWMLLHAGIAADLLLDRSAA